MRAIKPERPPFNEIVQVHGKLRINHKGSQFIFTKEDIEKYLSEGWGETESVFIEVDDVALELFPRDYRAMLKLIDSSHLI